jgi:hypothetical protein
MSDLENRAKPIFEGLLADGARLLDPSDQSILANWAVKSAMVFEALREGDAYFYTSGDRSLLKEASVFPSRTAVWLAKCIDLPGIYVNASDHAETPDHSPLGTRLFATTMGFGHVALQVVTMKLPAAAPVSIPISANVRAGPWEDLSLTLSASGSALRWPAKLSLKGELGLQAFAGRWFVPPTDSAAV